MRIKQKLETAEQKLGFSNLNDLANGFSTAPTTRMLNYCNFHADFDLNTRIETVRLDAAQFMKIGRANSAQRDIVL
jgi:hypothetical protein